MAPVALRRKLASSLFTNIKEDSQRRCSFGAITPKQRDKNIGRSVRCYMYIHPPTQRERRSNSISRILDEVHAGGRCPYTQREPSLNSGLNENGVRSSSSISRVACSERSTFGLWLYKPWRELQIHAKQQLVAGSPNSLH